jgi:hypoxanthine phosphoribosyltransferase
MENKTIQLHDLTFSTSISAEQIAERIEQLGVDLNLDYEGKNPIFIAVLNGAFVFTADLVREFKGNCELSFVKLASYAGTESSGDIATRIGLETEVRGRHIIVTEDIVDTGNTMNHFLQELRELSPASIQIASLLVKPDALQHDLDIKYIGFEIPTDFVVGYGLDYDGLGRNFPDIYSLVR